MWLAAMSRNDVVTLICSALHIVGLLSLSQPASLCHHISGPYTQTYLSLLTKSKIISINLEIPTQNWDLDNSFQYTVDGTPDGWGTKYIITSDIGYRVASSKDLEALFGAYVFSRSYKSCNFLSSVQHVWLLDFAETPNSTNQNVFYTFNN